MNYKPSNGVAWFHEGSSPLRLVPRPSLELMSSAKKKPSSVGSSSYPSIIPRVEAFLRTRPGFKSHHQTIVEHLLSNFQDYQRLGSSKLSLVVKQYLESAAYQKSKQRFLDEAPTSGDVDAESSSESEEDTTGLVEYPDTNSLNSSLRATYLKSNSQSSTPIIDGSTPVSGSAAPSPNPRTKVSVPRSKKRGRDEALPAPRPQEEENGLAKKKNRPTARYADLGGIESILQDVRELIERPLMHPEIFEWLGTQIPRGVLLHGPPGCGKTQLAMAIAGELGVSFFPISAPEVVSGMSGESEAKIRQLFQDAKARAPSIIFIDEIDAITPKRENAAREMERRIVAQLLTSMDELDGIPLPVMVIGATNRPDSLDQALRRSGRFDREISLNVPDQPARVRILKVIASRLRLSGDFDFDLIASNTPGYVGADLQAIAKEAASIAVNRIFSSLETFGSFTGKTPSMPSTPLPAQDQLSVAEEVTIMEETTSMEVDTASNTEINAVQRHHSHFESRGQVSDFLRANREPFTPDQLEPLSITMADFEEAIKRVQPSAKREGFATIPNVTWEDIGALTQIRHELEMALLEPIRSKGLYDALNIPVSLGVLLYGPPGCGKTLLAKAVANQAQANFISVKGPELLNKYVGESERAVRVVFQRARASSPCIIFFDEIDALVPKRTGGENQATERVVNQLLIELDGLEQRHGISVIAATNRPDIIDPAMLRPGRLDKLLYVPLPTPEERAHILRTCSRKTPLSSDVNLETIARNTLMSGFSGADIANLVREASMHALTTVLISKDTIKGDVPRVSEIDFQVALKKVMPSVSKGDQARYERLRNKLSSPHLLNPEQDDDAAAAPSK